MRLSRLGVLDLSFVTDTLVDLLRQCIQDWPPWPHGPPFTINPTGAAPDSDGRAVSDCLLSLYLFHVAPDPHQRNATVVGRRPHTIPEQPLSLDLYYLLSAYAKGSFHQEQQAMSIAMRCFHQHPIVRVPVPIPGLSPNVPEEFTLTLEPESIDSLSGIWQSIAAPLRLAAVYKASVVFITPPAPATDAAIPVQEIRLVADPTTLPFARDGQLIGTYRKVTYTSPLSTAGNPKLVSYDSSVATVAAGQRLILYGSGLSDGSGNPNPTAKRLYLLQPSAPEQEVTGWIVPDPDPTDPTKTVRLDSRLTLLLPAGAPTPGVYQLRLGSDTGAGDTVTYRSNAVPVSIAAAITAPAVVPPVFTTPSMTIAGTGFVAGQTEVLVGPIALTAGAAGAGMFQLSGTTLIDFQPPAGLAHGLYPVRVRVNHVESDPAWWVQI